MSDARFVAIYASVVIGVIVVAALLRSDAMAGFHILGHVVR